MSLVNGTAVLVTEPMDAALENALGIPAHRRSALVLGTTVAPENLVRVSEESGTPIPEGTEFYVIEPRDSEGRVPATMEDMAFYAMHNPGQLARAVPAEGVGQGVTCETLVLVGVLSKSEFGASEAARIESEIDAAVATADVDQFLTDLLGTEE